MNNQLMHSSSQINRRTATIRYMFHNKEDIEYFKPVKLRTRCGRLGHIKESLGKFKFGYSLISNENPNFLYEKIYTLHNQELMAI